MRLVLEADLLAEAHSLAQRIIERPQGSVTSIKRAINAGFHSSREDSYFSSLPLVLAPDQRW